MVVDCCGQCDLIVQYGAAGRLRLMQAGEEMQPQEDEVDSGRESVSESRDSLLHAATPEV